jgi:hypothetical protein
VVSGGRYKAAGVGRGVVVGLVLLTVVCFLTDRCVVLLVVVVVGRGVVVVVVRLVVVDVG